MISKAPAIAKRAPRGGAIDGLPARHPLRSLIVKAYRNAEFAARWDDRSDSSFRPFCLAILEFNSQGGNGATPWSHIIRDMTERKRETVLSEAAKRTVTPRMIKALGRTDWPDFTLADWDLLLALLADRGKNAALGHIDSISTTLVRQFRWIPDELKAVRLLTVLNDLSVPQSHWVVLVGYLGKTSEERHAALLRSARIVSTRGDFWDFFFECQSPYERPFALPSTLVSSALLEPIGSPRDLEAESLLMANCLRTRVSRVLQQSRIYFHLREGPLADAELIRKGNRWIPGEILGPKNTHVTQPLYGRIRTELERLASSLSTTVHSQDGVVARHIDELRQKVRDQFTETAIARVTDLLKDIQGKSRSWSDGAYGVLEAQTGEYVQFMSSPDGTEYLVEVASHKYSREADRRLTSEAVDVIEGCGFIWPHGKHNFLRWFDAGSSGDLDLLAEVALGMLSRVFGYQGRRPLKIQCHIPNA